MIFGVECLKNDAKIVLLPVPWEATVSYGKGSAKGPEAILKASPQLDLELINVKAASHIYMEPINHELIHLSQQMSSLAHQIREEFNSSKLDQFNNYCENMNDWVYNQILQIIESGKCFGLIGGEHSVSLGALQALSEIEPHFGILHFDAHADLRNSYEGFIYSHASIMRNILKLPNPPKKLIQVGVRDFCKEELDFIQSRKETIHTFFDNQLKEKLFEGSSWKTLCDEIISCLPQNVYISFDIDGLSPLYCPGTGTPVPGGLSFDQAIYLIQNVVKSGRKIIGFDLVEVALGFPEQEWNANVGARIIYQLCAWMLKSQH